MLQISLLGAFPLMDESLFPAMACMIDSGKDFLDLHTPALTYLPDCLCLQVFGESYNGAKGMLALFNVKIRKRLY